MALDYDSPESRETIDKILAYLIGRPLHGATQQQIADMLAASVQTANRFMQHLVMKGRAHIAIKAQALHRNSPAVYKYGWPIVTHFSGQKYNDLPLAFFSGSKPKRKRRMNKENAAGSAAQDKMTGWFSAQRFNPTRQGPYQCRSMETLGQIVVDDETCKKHMRWFNGERWSYPLQPDHEREDGYVKPHDDYFIEPDFLPAFGWRGFTSDQEPL